MVNWNMLVCFMYVKVNVLFIGQDHTQERHKLHSAWNSNLSEAQDFRLFSGSTFSNKTTEVCLLNSYDHLIEYAYNLQLTDEQGRPVPMTPYMETAGRGRPRPHSDFLLPDRDVRPKESKQWPQPIDLLNLFEIKNAGVYMLTASGNFRFLPSRRLCHSVSAPLRITVVNPSSEPKSSTDRIR